MSPTLAVLREEDLLPLLETAWRSHLGAGDDVTVRRLSRGQYVDSPTVFAANVDGQARAVVSAASPTAPRMVERTALRTHAARQALAAVDPHRVLEPLAVEHVQGISCALFPLCEALGSRRLLSWWINRRVAATLFDWLLDVARATRQAAPEGAAVEAVRENLQAMARHPALDYSLRESAALADGALVLDRWMPCWVLMHGDLWRGNVMLRRDLPGGHTRRLVVIDWAGCQVDGWPLFDLIRLADSLGVPARSLAQQILRHCALLAITPEQARYGVAAALAQTLSRLENFPVDHFAAMARRTLLRFDGAARFLS
jgi:Phosphotransferase enzyme family